MQKRQLMGLFLVTGAPYIVGNAVIPIYPLQLKALGANESLIGLYLAAIFIGLFLGTLSSGWLSDHFRIRRPFIFIGMGMMVISLLMMTQANTPLTLSLSLTTAWFGGGLSGGVVTTLAGLYAEPAKRGKVFGILGMSRGAAAIIGGTIGSIVIKQVNFETLLSILALSQLLIMIAATMIEDRFPIQPQPRRNIQEAVPMMSGAFLALLAAGVLISAVHFSAGLGRPLKMNSLQLDQSAIMTTSIAAGIVGLLMPYIVGWLSDRLARKRLLIVTYGVIMMGVIALSQASTLWQFWLSTILFSAGGAGFNVGAALVTDMTPKEALSSGMARYSSTPWLGAAIGFSLGGFLIQTIGLDRMFVLMTIVPIITMWLISTVNPKTQIRVTQTQTMVAVGAD